MECEEKMTCEEYVVKKLQDTEKDLSNANTWLKMTEKKLEMAEEKLCRIVEAIAKVAVLRNNEKYGEYISLGSIWKADGKDFEIVKRELGKLLKVEKDEDEKDERKEV